MNHSLMDDVFTKELINAKRNIKIFGMSVDTLNIEEQIVYLCLHFIKHRSLDGNLSSHGALMQLNDIYLTLMKYNDPDWDRIHSLSVKYEVQNYLCIALKLVSYYFDNGNKDLKIPKRIIEYTITGYELDSLKMNLLLIDRVKYSKRLRAAATALLKKLKIYSLSRPIYNTLKSRHLDKS